MVQHQIAFDGGHKRRQAQSREHVEKEDAGQEKYGIELLPGCVVRLDLLIIVDGWGWHWVALSYGRFKKRLTPQTGTNYHAANLRATQLK
jgi:hypothetical protein